jgi:cytochrome c peroxidase
LGDKIFHDPGLSSSGRMSCATCHDPAHGHAGADGLASTPGGLNLTTPGFRNAPSLNYLRQNAVFFFDDEGTPTGGFNRDGRANSLTEQARRPLLAEHEMANASIAAVVDKLKSAAYVEEFRNVFGAGILETPDVAFDRITFALERYQREDPEFSSLDSKYDFFLAGKATFTDRELRGLALYNNPAKGNCAACHPNARGADGSPPLFTDFTYDNFGVPRNPDIAANADPAYFDLGLCGPFRTDLADRADLCGAFKVPTLRNVALTAPYFHNGRFKTLNEVLSFYVRRDTNPEEWYPMGPNGVEKFDDLPVEFHGNVNVTEAPYNRTPGDAPALNAQEIEDVVAYLKTLTDGYTP